MNHPVPILLAAIILVVAIVGRRKQLHEQRHDLPNHRYQGWVTAVP